MPRRSGGLRLKTEAEQCGRVNYRSHNERRYNTTANRRPSLRSQAEMAIVDREEGMNAPENTIWLPSL